MHEPGIAQRQRDGDPRAHERPLTGRQLDVDGAGEIDTRVAGAGRSRHGKRRIQPQQLDVERPPGGRGGGRLELGSIDGAGHNGRRYPRFVNEHPSSTGPATSGGSGFDERLSVPWWWYLPALGVAVLLAAEVHMGYPGIRSWIGYAVIIPLVMGTMVWLGRVRVRVVDGELHAGDAALPLRFVGQVEIIRDPAAKQVALGPDLDPTAHLVHRAWVRPVVRIELTDPADPTPYWVISVRDAEGLVAALGR